MLLERYISNYNLEDIFIELVDCDSNETITTGYGREFLDCYFSSFQVSNVSSCNNGYIIIQIF